MALVTIATWLKDGEASDSSGDGHYTTGATIPGTSVKGVRFQPGDSEPRWLMFNKQTGVFASLDEPDIHITAMLHLASAPPTGGGDTIMDFKDDQGGTGVSKLSVYALDDGTLKFIDAGYSAFIKDSGGSNDLQTPVVEGGTYWLQIAAGTGATAALRIKLFTLDGTEVFDSGSLTANLGTENYDRIQIGRTTLFNTSPMDIYYGPLAIGTGTTPYAPGFRAGRQDPVEELTDSQWSVESIADFGDDDLGTVAATSTEDDRIRLAIQTRAQVGINAQGVLGVRVFARMDTTGMGTQATLFLWHDGNEAATDTFEISQFSNEAFSLIADGTPGSVESIEPEHLDEYNIGVTCVHPGTTDVCECAELGLLSLYYPAEDSGGGGAGADAMAGHPSSPQTRAMLRLMGVRV